VTTATAIFRAIMLECERRRVALGFPMEKFSEYAGLPERYYPKALHADLPSGRQAQWGTLQTIIDALFPTGFDVEIRARPGSPQDYESLKAQLLQLRAHHDPRSQRDLMRGLSVKAAAGRKAIPAKRRRAIARRAAKMRWRKPKVVEIVPKIGAEAGACLPR
jgi:hypothetical protein